MRPRNRNGKDKGFIYTTRPGQTDTNPPPSKTHIIIWPWLPARQLVWNSARLMTLHSDPSMQVHFDDVSLYGTPKEEPMPNIPIVSEKVSANFLKSQLQSWFQPTDNRLAMKLFGSRKALVKERIRQKTSGHWVIHPCSSFRWVPTINTERSRDMSSTNPMISYISIQVLLGPLHAFIISSKSYYPASRNIILQRWSEHTMDCLQLPKWYYFFNRYCSQF